MKKILGWSLIILGILLFFVASLLAYRVYFSPEPTPGEPLTPLKLRLKWIHQGQFAGFYAAERNGFYRDAGLDVRINPGGQEMNAIRLVASGTDDVGVWGAEQIMIARSNGIPVRAIGVVYQKTAACFLVREDSGIGSFKDIEGKRVGTQRGTDLETIYEALLSIKGVNRDNIREVNVSYNFPLFLTGQIDVWPSYAVNEPYKARQQDVDIKILYPHENGLQFYGDTIFTSDQFARQNPKVIKRFMAATREGWKWVLKNPKEAARITVEYDRTLDPEHQKYMIEKSEPLIRSDGQLLRMNDQGWMEIHRVLKELKLIDRDVSVSEVYTNEYLP